eukprot:gene13432-biopygen3545
MSVQRPGKVTALEGCNPSTRATAVCPTAVSSAHRPACSAQEKRVRAPRARSVRKRARASRALRVRALRGARAPAARWWVGRRPRVDRVGGGERAGRPPQMNVVKGLRSGVGSVPRVSRISAGTLKKSRHAGCSITAGALKSAGQREEPPRTRSVAAIPVEPPGKGAPAGVRRGITGVGRIPRGSPAWG